MHQIWFRKGRPYIQKKGGEGEIKYNVEYAGAKHGPYKCVSMKTMSLEPSRRCGDQN
jgi:hypothetical protein